MTRARSSMLPGCIGLSLLASAALFAACGGTTGDEDMFSTPDGTSGAAGVGGAGSSGSGGAAGEGSAGNAGSAGEGSSGSAGSAGEGSSGNAGSAGEGSSGSGGTAGEGSSGDAGSAGEGSAGEGSGGSAGEDNGGSAGDGGEGSGSAGSAGEGSAGEGSGGSAGEGNGGSAGDGGEAGTAGSGGGETNTPSGPLAGADTCPGTPVTLVGGLVELTGTTANAANNYNSGGNTCGGSNSGDVVYAVTPTQSGELTISVMADFHPAFFVRTGSNCTNNNANAQYTCKANLIGSNVSDQISVTAGTTYYVVIDGIGTGKEEGTYKLSLDLKLPVCGNGQLETGEECEDNNALDGDGCSAKCLLEEACVIAEATENSQTIPQDAPTACKTIRFHPASFSSGGDTDFYCVEAAGGQKLTGETFIGTPGSCPMPSATLLEVFQDVPKNALNNTNCSNNNGSKACNTGGGVGNCSKLTYTVPNNAGGKYCFRVLSRGGPISNYGLDITIR